VDCALQQRSGQESRAVLAPSSPLQRCELEDLNVIDALYTGAAGRGRTRRGVTRGLRLARLVYPSDTAYGANCVRAIATRRVCQSPESPRCQVEQGQRGFQVVEISSESRGGKAWKVGTAVETFVILKECQQPATATGISVAKDSKYRLRIQAAEAAPRPDEPRAAARTSVTMARPEDSTAAPRRWAVDV
jgi:hypothetical protein